MYFLKAISHFPHFKVLPCSSTNNFISGFCTLSLLKNVLNQESVSSGELIAALNFNQRHTSYAEKRFSGLRSPDTPFSVLKLLQNLGFSESQMLKIVHSRPQVLFADAEKNLKPKLDFFQTLGIVGSDLGRFISKTPRLLTDSSLEKTLVPSVDILRDIVKHNVGERDFVEVVKKCGYILAKIPGSCFASNLAFFRSCGIVESQLTMLLRSQPRLFISRQSFLRDLVTRTTHFGIPMGSRMFVHALMSISSVSVENCNRKVEVFTVFGFTKPEIVQMFTNGPYLLTCSEDKLKVGLEFFLYTVMLEKSAVILNPRYLMYSMEERSVPRYRVFKMIKSKKLMKKEPSFLAMMSSTEDRFLQRYVACFKENSAELLSVYKGNQIDGLCKKLLRK